MQIYLSLPDSYMFSKSINAVCLRKNLKCDLFINYQEKLGVIQRFSFFSWRVLVVSLCVLVFKHNGKEIMCFYNWPVFLSHIRKYF